VPAEILAKPTRLTKIEFDLIKEHPQAGYDILKGIDFPWPVAQMVHQHHERLDGSGYPQGLKGDAIALEARVLAVADVVEAMSSHRPYRPGLGIEAALKEIEAKRGIWFDAAAADVCLRLFREKGYKLPD
jgi:HD-GYP domain-containing protein (c-di-GMP phosphodiesterase class II)